MIWVFAQLSKVKCSTLSFFQLDGEGSLLINFSLLFLYILLLYFIQLIASLRTKEFIGSSFYWFFGILNWNLDCEINLKLITLERTLFDKLLLFFVYDLRISLVLKPLIIKSYFSVFCGLPRTAIMHHVDLNLEKNPK